MYDLIYSVWLVLYYVVKLKYMVKQTTFQMVNHGEICRGELGRAGFFSLFLIAYIF